MGAVVVCGWLTPRTPSPHPQPHPTPTMCSPHPSPSLKCGRLCSQHPPSTVTVAPLLDTAVLRLQADTFLAEMQSRAEHYRNWHEEHSSSSSSGSKSGGGTAPCATEHLWRSLETQAAVLEHISEFHKLAELVGCPPTGSMINEQQLSSMTNIKTELHSRLQQPRT